MNWWNLIYMGSIYQEKQNPTILFDGLAQFLAETKYNKSALSVDFYGSQYPLLWLSKEIEKWNLCDIVKQHEAIPHWEAIKIEKEASWLWVMGWEDPKENGVTPYKLFEYLGSGRPILLTGGYKNAEVVKILKETYAGMWCPNAEAVKSFLYDTI